MCKSIRETHEPKQVPTDAAEELEKETTRSRTSRKRPPKCADLVVANGRWSLTRIEPQEVSLRRKLNTSTLRRIIYCMQFPSYGMCSSMLLLFLPQEIRKLVGWSLKRGWKQCKIIKEIPAGRLTWVSFGVLDRWSHMEFQLYSNRVNHLSRRCD